MLSRGPMLVFLLSLAACSDLALTAPEGESLQLQKDIVALDYHCHDDDDDGGGGGDDGPIMTAADWCHYVPGGPGDGDGGGDGGGGGDEGSADLGFLVYIDRAQEQQSVDPHHAPKCPPPSPTQWGTTNASKGRAANAYMWCKAKAPTLEQRRILTKAIFRIKDRGPVCKEIADRAHELLIEGKFKIYTNNVLPSALRPYNSGGAGYIEGVILLDKYLGLLNDVAGQKPYRVNLEYAIVHESQHVKGARHLTVTGQPEYYRRNTYDQGCAGFIAAPK